MATPEQMKEALGRLALLAANDPDAAAVLLAEALIEPPTDLTDAVGGFAQLATGEEGAREAIAQRAAEQGLPVIAPMPSPVKTRPTGVEPTEDRFGDRRRRAAPTAAPGPGPELPLVPQESQARGLPRATPPPGPGLIARGQEGFQQSMAAQSPDIATLLGQLLPAGSATVTPSVRTPSIDPFQDPFPTNIRPHAQEASEVTPPDPIIAPLINQIMSSLFPGAAQLPGGNPDRQFGSGGVPQVTPQPAQVPQSQSQPGSPGQLSVGNPDRQFGSGQASNIPGGGGNPDRQFGSGPAPQGGFSQTAQSTPEEDEDDQVMQLLAALAALEAPPEPQRFAPPAPPARGVANFNTSIEGTLAPSRPNVVPTLGQLIGGR